MPDSPETTRVSAAPGLSAGGDLRALARLAADAGADAIAAEAAAAVERIADGRFYVACFGQFKRGKSSLLNALVGAPVLPVGVLPVTSVPTVVRWGERSRARVRFAGGASRDIPTEDLGAYVAGEKNPENRLGVEAAEVFVPSPLLESGMCLVDTPGVGSVFAGNTRAAHAFVPHVDAAVVVLGADPPISGEELALVDEVAREAENVLFVLNKADRLSSTDCGEALRFTERLLAERKMARPRVLVVSAAERLASGPTRDWGRFEQELERLAESGAGLVRAAEGRAVSRLQVRLLAHLDAERDALVRPFAESERRITALTASVAAAERSLADLGYLLAGEAERLARAFADDREGFLTASVGPAREELRKTIADAGDGSRRLRSRAAEVAISIARRRLDIWLAGALPAAEDLYRTAADRFVALGNEFLGRFLSAGDLAADGLPAEIDSDVGFRGRSRLFFTELLSVSRPPVSSWLADRFRTRAALRRAVLRDASRYLERLLSSNSARVQNDLVERVRESRRLLEAEIRVRLSGAVRTAAGALEHAKARRAGGEASVRSELGRLARLRRAAEALRPAGLSPP